MYSKSGVITTVSHIAFADTGGSSESSINNRLCPGVQISQHRNDKVLLLRVTSPTVLGTFTCFSSLLHFLPPNIQQEVLISIIVMEGWNPLYFCKKCSGLSLHLQEATL